MRAHFWLILGALACSTSLAMAASMPKLPSMPPLPTDYVPASDVGGFYVGILAGPTFGDTTNAMFGIVVGHDLDTTGLDLSVEALALRNAGGSVSFEGDLVAGVDVSRTVKLFATAGVGYQSADATFASVGGGVSLALNENWSVRAQYRYAHDLTGDPAVHSLLMGIVHHF